MTKPEFENNELYHIYNRGVEKRDVFMDDNDHKRFLHDMYEFNDTAAAIPSNVRLGLKESKLPAQLLEVQPPKVERKKRDLLVEILAFVLMPNHFHFLVRQKRENGVVKFMQKIGTGYTMYFNQKYERVGCLFQGRFKAVAVETEAHFYHLPYYIHANPVSIIEPKWRENGIRNLKHVMNFIREYRWSSYLDYLEKKNYPSLTQRSSLQRIFGSPAKLEKEMEAWLKGGDFSDVPEVVNMSTFGGSTSKS